MTQIIPIPRLPNESDAGRRGGPKGEETLRERVAREHVHLGTLFDDVGRTLEERRPIGEFREAFYVLANELETHFDQEDRLYYPAIRGLRPEFESQLLNLTERHTWFRDQLRRISDHLLHDDIEGAGSVFRSVVHAFDGHERTEDDLLLALGNILEGS